MSKESLKLFESVEFDKGKSVSNNHYSNKMLGVVNAAIYKNGKKTRESIDTNEIIMPGSIFVLEQMFKTKFANRMEYNIPTSIHTNSEQYPEIILKESAWNNPSDISGEKIFGFMVGNGGTSVDGKNVVDYDSKFLCDKKGNPSFIPFRVTDAAPNGYKFVVRNKDKDGANEKYFAYVKDFQEGPAIYRDEDGSIYAEMKLEITGDEFKEFYALEESDDTTRLESFNQLGLVAGYNVGSTYDDIRLVTMINFQNYYLEEDEVLKMTYRIYSLQ